MLTEQQTKELLSLLTKQQKQELADTLNSITGREAPSLYSVATIDKYITTRIPNKLLQPIKRYLLNNSKENLAHEKSIKPKFRVGANIPAQLHKRIKLKCLEENLTFTDFAIKAMTEFLDKD